MQATISRFAAEHVDARGLQRRARALGYIGTVEISVVPSKGWRITCRIRTAELLERELHAGAETATTEPLRLACRISAEVVHEEIGRAYTPGRITS